MIGGSINQTTMLHEVGKALGDCDVAYTPYYTDGYLEALNRLGLLDFTVAGHGGQFRRRTSEYLRDQQLPVDEEGRLDDYDLVVTGSDLIIQRNIRHRPIVLVQEGMTDPENLAYHLVRHLRLPRWIASTSTTGLSLAYRKFCVASEGYRDFFIAKGVPADRLVVTGIPNCDHCARLLENDWPDRGYVLVATSDARETLKLLDSRRRFLAFAKEKAAGRRVVFKLHPNEHADRATREIHAVFPGAQVVHKGPTDAMIANCEALITQYSTVVYVGLALGKECHSYYDVAALRRMTPMQNGGTSAARIADVCRDVLARASGAARVPELARAAS
ncbi:MAG: hypothetical protein HY275_08660 [Gemmatimonadetes bacterium]|nr:hypothetical protein [Gemmatimonadota bacterium]